MGGGAGATGAAAAAGALAGGDAAQDPGTGTGFEDPASKTSQYAPPMQQVLSSSPSRAYTGSTDPPLIPDGAGNDLASGIVTGPIAAVGESVDLGLYGSSTLYHVANSTGKGLIEQTDGDFASDLYALPPSDPPWEPPNDYGMGKTLHTEDGTQTNPDGSWIGQYGIVHHPDGSNYNPDTGDSQATDGSITNPQGWTTSLDGTATPPANVSPAFNPDGTPALSDPTIPPS